MSDDRDEISNLIARYAELLNLGQIDALGELFRHGKITATSTDQVHEGTEAVKEMYRASVVFPEKLPDTLLFTSNLQIDVDGDSATGKAYFLGMSGSGGRHAWARHVPVYDGTGICERKGRRVSRKTGSI